MNMFPVVGTGESLCPCRHDSGKREEKEMGEVRWEKRRGERWKEKKQN
jgi:ferredoxin-thioredoxin reductase catalytic subunit